MEPDEGIISVRIGDYCLDVPVSSFPDWPVSKFRKLLKLIRDEWNTRPEEWGWMEGRLTRGLKEAKTRLKAAKEAYQENYSPTRCRTEEAQHQRALNRSLETDMKRAKSMVRHWERLQKIYNDERNKMK